MSHEFTMIQRQLTSKARSISRILILQSNFRYQNRFYSKMAIQDTSIPVFTAGGSAEVGKAIKEGLLPEYDVIHLSLSVESVKEDLPRILRGDHVIPSSGLGSNLDRPADAQRLPKLLVAGGGFSAEEFEDMKNSIDLTAGGKLTGSQIPLWVERNVVAGPPKGPDGKPINIKLPSGEFSPVFVGVVVANARTKLDEAARECGLI
ncbi:hypothetical protein EYR41_000135 [Orbilia oligospora]|uniref:Uncharacterized protein n=1 Tax=Orbilia oligospora TaxID=2813651 RepID=A0A7C8PXR6_ORBOL|nr:hypothetical protein TWF751_004170 [Orbilia oligospora]KAF3296396.1 hypothetical protein TWF132_010990 [Orbilia oligospora]TGJ73016.1 hypothetical protein EYR41_000135 [Orbilia oligospora]